MYKKRKNQKRVTLANILPAGFFVPNIRSLIKINKPPAIFTFSHFGSHLQKVGAVICVTDLLFRESILP